MSTDVKPRAGIVHVRAPVMRRLRLVDAAPPPDAPPRRAQEPPARAWAALRPGTGERFTLLGVGFPEGDAPGHVDLALWRSGADPAPPRAELDAWYVVNSKNPHELAVPIVIKEGWSLLLTADAPGVVVVEYANTREPLPV